MTEYYLVEREELINLIASQLELMALENDEVSFREVKQANIPKEFYNDPKLSDKDKENFQRGNITFNQVAAAMVKYEYRKADNNE